MKVFAKIPLLHVHGVPVYNECVPITNPETHRLGGIAKAAGMTAAELTAQSRKMLAARKPMSEEQLSALGKRLAAARRTKRANRLKEAA